MKALVSTILMVIVSGLASVGSASYVECKKRDSTLVCGANKQVPTWDQECGKLGKKFFCDFSAPARPAGIPREYFRCKLYKGTSLCGPSQVQPSEAEICVNVEGADDPFCKFKK
jgi:hypothetical protein